MRSSTAHNNGMAMSDALITVEVAYALPHEQTVVTVQAAANSTLHQIIEQSGILQRHPEIDLTQQKIGIFSRQASLAQTARAGDRVEIYRPLQADPKQARKQRASSNAD